MAKYSVQIVGWQGKGEMTSRFDVVDYKRNLEYSIYWYMKGSSRTNCSSFCCMYNPFRLDQVVGDTVEDCFRKIYGGLPNYSNGRVSFAKPEAFEGYDPGSCVICRNSKCSGYVVVDLKCWEGKHERRFALLDRIMPGSPGSFVFEDVSDCFWSYCMRPEGTVHVVFYRYFGKDKAVHHSDLLFFQDGTYQRCGTSRGILSAREVLFCVQNTGV